MFTLPAETPAAHPAEWLEPPERSDQTGEELSETVVPLDMSEFVKENHAPAGRGPLETICRKENMRPEQSKGQGHDRRRRKQQLRYADQVAVIAQLLKEQVPLRVFEQSGLSRGPQDVQISDDDGCKGQKDAGNPDEQGPI